MDNKTELNSINGYASIFLGLGDNALPATLNSALNTVFTKERDNADDDVKAFRGKVITEIKTDHNSHYPVLLGKSNAIYNALCLIVIVGVGATKNIFKHAVQIKKKKSLSSLLEQKEEQKLLFFCLGIHNENVAEIELKLGSEYFDLFTDKLPSPFGYSKNDKHNLAPMLTFFKVKIPWQDYVNDYQAAEKSYVAKDLDSAKQQLELLEKKALLPLPMVTSLKERIVAQQIEAEEASDYLQSLLNYK
ncbi:hypothetical protein [Moritella yayanosii]|nr:hypothetical protein [Moritella yayanosii]